MRYSNFLLLACISILFINLASAQTTKKDLNYYLPDIQYDINIPTPESYLGFQVGEWHTTHDQLTGYMKLLAEKSDRVEYSEYARSHENRPLFVLLISSPENLRNKENIKKSHNQLLDNATANTVNTKELPAILYQGYTIHGNEPSGNNAALLVAYYLAAGQSEAVIQTLNNTLILMDPCLNPDGTQRFATWVNSHKGKTLITDPASREYNEVWPGGRYNHYWFDMNRDWLLLVHPESRGRIKLFQEWRPNVLTDHHEMGTNATFFFQPGIPSGTNPNTPQINQDLTEEIGTFHAAALDSIGSRYYTKASFDDFYYGKGSTYPDAQGCIGILFEQASSRGHLQESVNGLVSFPFTIRNQVVTSLSTHKAIVNLRHKLLDYKKNFKNLAFQDIQNSPIKSYIFTDSDENKLNQFLDLLLQHQIEVYPLDKSINAGGVDYLKDKSYVVPLIQKQPILAKTMFEKVNTFQDSSFYDVSGWTVAAAYNLQFASQGEIAYTPSKKLNTTPTKKGGINGNPTNLYAFIFESKNMNAHKILYQLQNKGLSTFCLFNDMKMQIDQQKIEFTKGSIVVPIQNQPLNKDEIYTFLSNLAVQNNISVFALTSGNGTNEMTLGHPNVYSLGMPKAAMIVGQGIAPQSAGEIWHHADLLLDLPITMIENNRFRQTNLSRYNTLIFPDGNYNSLGEADVNKLKDWVRSGNQLILIGRAVAWASNQKLIQLTEKKSETVKNNFAGIYGNLQKDNASGVLGGSILEVQIDRSHPLFFGYQSDKLAFMRNGTRFYQSTKNLYASPAKYTANYLVSGYIPKSIKNDIAEAASVTVHGLGAGKMIAFHDNPLFRGYWLGGHRVFNNALFFGRLISNATLESNP